VPATPPRVGGATSPTPPTAPAAAPLAAGARFADRYELIAPLGAGGFGAVWRARDGRPRFLGRAMGGLLP
jgi:hypothetical protein